MEDGFFEIYGPTWMRKRTIHLTYGNTINKVAPVPDCVNSGPVIYSKKILPDGDLVGLEETDEKLKHSKKAQVKPTKKVCMKFPMKMPEPYVKPLNRHVSWNVLPYNVKPESNYLNTLSSFKLEGEEYILFGEPTKDSCILKVAKIAADPEDSEAWTSKKVRNICKYDNLYQINSAVINNVAYALARIDNSITFFNLGKNNLSFCSINEKQTVDCCLNSSVNKLFSFVNEDGSVYIYDVQKQLPTWQGKFNEPLKSEYKWFRCEFGSHPLHLNIANRNYVHLIDTRVSIDKSRKIFEMDIVKNFIHESSVINSLRNIPNSPFFYVSCSESVILMDNRYCKYPVLTWHHMLKSEPSFSSFVKRDDLDFLILMNSLESKLSINASKRPQSEYPAITALSTVKHFNLLRDTMDFARRRGFWFNNKVEKQLNAPLVGISTSTLKTGFLVCIQNSYGNIFYAKIFTRDEKPQILPITSKNSIKCLKSFEKEVCKPLELNFNHKVVLNIEGLNRKTYNCRTVEENSDWKGMLWKINEINCHKRCEHYIKDKTSLTKLKYRKAAINFFPKSARKLFSIKNLDLYSDELSKKMLEVWDLKPEDELRTPTVNKENKNLEWCYQRTPFHIKNEKRIPKLKKAKPNSIHDDSLEQRSNSNENIAECTKDTLSNKCGDKVVDNNTTVVEHTSLLDHSVEVSQNSSVLSERLNKKRKRSRADGF